MTVANKPQKVITFGLWVTYLIPNIPFLRSPDNLEHGRSFDEVRTAYIFAVAGVPFWSIAISLVKVSVALTLLKFLQTTAWRTLLYSLIITLVGTMVAFIIWLLQPCRPISAYWDIFAPLDKCASLTTRGNIIVALSVIHILMDLVLTATPLAFIVRLHRPRRERVLLSMLIVVGLGACTASIAKTLTAQKLSSGEHMDDLAVELSVWNSVELFLASSAACMPALKPCVQWMIERMGFVMQKSYVASSLSNSVVLSKHSSGPGSRNGPGGDSLG